MKRKRESVASVGKEDASRRLEGRQLVAREKLVRVTGGCAQRFVVRGWILSVEELKDLCEYLVDLAVLLARLP